MHSKPSVNGCYYYFNFQHLYIRKEVSFSVHGSVKFSSNCIFGGPHQFFVVGFPAPDPRGSWGPFHFPTLRLLVL